MEMLVVVALVALLAALIAPTWMRASESARRLKCARNLQQIGHLMQVWTADRNGRLVPGSQGRTWPVQLAMDVMGEGQSVLAGKLRYDVFYCPTLNGVGCDGNSTPTVNYWTNYTGNSQVMGFGSSAYPFRKITEFEKPSRIGVVWDAAVLAAGPPARSSMVGSYYHVQAGNPSQSVGWVHGATDALHKRGGIANVLFLDGHVESQSDPGTGNYLDIVRSGPGGTLQ